LIARLGFLKIALVFVFVAPAFALNAQTYNVTPDAQKGAQAQPAQAQSGDQNLGFGSNIQNARLARAAELALQKGDHAEALDFARRAVQAAPNDPHLWFLVGYAARLNSKFQESVNAYERGLKLSPSSVDGLSGLAQTYNIMGRTDDAERLLKEVVAANPRRRDDTLLLGDIYMRGGDYTTALDWLSKAERLQPDARSELLMALSYQHMKQMDLASRYLDMARHRAPNNPDVERSMAGYFREVGNYNDAIAALKSIHSPKPDVLAELAYTYQLAGKMDDSARVYAQAANASPKDLTLQLSAAQAQIGAGSIDKATVFVQRAAALNPNYYRLHALRGEIARIEDQEQDAVKEYNLAISTLPANPTEGPLYGIQLHMDLMNLYKDLGNDDAAHQQLQTAQTQINALGEMSVGRAPFLRLRATIRMSGDDNDGALKDVKEALSIDPKNRDDLQLNGDILMKLKRTEDAIVVYKQVLAMDADNRYALTSLGYASRAAGRDEDAEKYFQHLAKVAPTLYIPYLALGDLYTAKRDFTRAQTSYNKAFALAPTKALIMAGGMNAAIEAHNLPLAETWLSRVSADMNQEPQILREKERYFSFKGDYQQSAVLGEQALKMLPHDRDVVVYLGYDLLRLEKYDELLALTTKYMDVFPKEPDLPLLEGYVHKHAGESEQARKDFTEALARDPEVVTAYVNRGYMLNDLHEPALAAEDFEAALRREPNNGEAHLGLAYASLDLHKPAAALRNADLAERAMGDGRDVHVIRATAYGREGMLTKAATEYRAALKFTPNDGALHLGLGNTLFAQRHYHEAIDELRIAVGLSPEDATVYALLARAYANLQDKDQTMHYVQLAEQKAQSAPPPPKGMEPEQSQIYVATGEALSTLGDQKAAMDRFTKALEVPNANRVSVRLAIGQLMAQQGHDEDAERQIALALMESESGETEPPSGGQYVLAADVFRAMHDYQLSQTYLQRAKAAGAPDPEVRVGLANNYLALGDTTRAQAELAAVKVEADSAPDYQYLMAEANVARQRHHDAQALTSFAQASNAEGEDQTAERALLEAGGNEGLRVGPKVSLLADFSIEPIFEDSTVYVLDSKLDAAFPVTSTDTSLLPPPRSSIQTQTTEAYHLHVGQMPTISGFFQLRNSRGQISVPATNSVVNRDTTDYTFNTGINPTVNIGHNVLTFNSGIQGTFRRDSETPVALNQNLFRAFTYVSTSSFFNAVSLSAYVIHESGPFTESNINSSSLTAAVDFRVGAPWGKNSLVTGWGRSDQKFSPVNYEDYYTSSYIGFERRFTDKLDARAMVEDLRAWRVVNTNSGIAQDLRPAGTVDFRINNSWQAQVNGAYSSTRGFHVYDAIQTGFFVSYARPFRRTFNDDSGQVVLQYPIRFSAGMQEETFFNFTGGHNQQLRPFVRISIF
jgi:tetratricopeptide (TPR) repeat protein